jgi:hypothetical protein
MGIERVKVTGIKLVVAVGKVLELTKRQAETRSLSLTAVDRDKGLYRVEKMVEFCAGEELGIQIADLRVADLDVVNRPGAEETLGQEKRKSRKKDVTVADLDAVKRFGAGETLGQEKRKSRKKDVATSASTGSATGKAKSAKPKEKEDETAPVGEGKKTIDVTA